MNSRLLSVIPIFCAIALLVLLIATNGRIGSVFGSHLHRNLPGLKSAIISQGASDFSDVDRKLLTDYGITFPDDFGKNLQCYDSVNPLENKHPDYCTMHRRGTQLSADAQFIKKWHKSSPELEAWMLQHGWKKVWNENQPISEILDKPHNDTSIGVNYEKVRDGITCTQTLMWIGPPTPNQLTPEQECVGSLR